MLSQWRHIGKMLLIALLVMSCTSCARWCEAKMVIAEADSCFGFIIYRLKHTYHLRNSELKICLMVLLDFPNKEIARIVSYKEDSYPTIKRRLATKLGTSSTEMRNFLLDLIVKIL